MNVPEMLRNYRVYEEGYDMIGTADVEMPTLDALTETIKGAGIAGEIAAPVIGHLGSAETKLNWRTVTMVPFTQPRKTLAEPSRTHMGEITAHWVLA